MRARELLPPTYSVLLWFSVWHALGWVIGYTFEGHFWIVIPIAAGIHGLIAGVVFTAACTLHRRKIARVSAARSIAYGVVAGAVALATLRLLTSFSVSIPLVVIPLDGLFGLLVGVIFFRASPHGPQRA